MPVPTPQPATLSAMRGVSCGGVYIIRTLLLPEQGRELYTKFPSPATTKQRLKTLKRYTKQNLPLARPHPQAPARRGGLAAAPGCRSVEEFRALRGRAWGSRVHLGLGSEHPSNNQPLPVSPNIIPNALDLLWYNGNTHKQGDDGGIELYKRAKGKQGRRSEKYLCTSF